MSKKSLVQKLSIILIILAVICWFFGFYFAILFWNDDIALPLNIFDEEKPIGEFSVFIWHVTGAIQWYLTWIVISFLLYQIALIMKGEHNRV